MQSNYSIIEAKLNDFIHKFYLNRIVIGIILFLLVSIVAFFSAFMIESVAFMKPFTKTLLFYFLVFISVSLFIFFVSIPFLKLLKIIPFISHEEASKIISDYFTDSKDTLINVLQLNNLESSDLLIASINQKISLISPLNFTNAINIKKTTKFFFVSLGVLLILILFGSIFNSNFSKGSERFLNYQTFYQPENPYSIKVLNDSLYCSYGDDFIVNIKTSGPSILNDVFLHSDLFDARMNSDSVDYFSYTLRNVTSEIEFNFNYLGFSSDLYKIQVFHKPSVVNSSISVIPPSYTGIKSDEFDNTGDFTVPYGSQIVWDFDVSHETEFDFYIDSVAQKVESSDSKYVSRKTALKTFDYSYELVGEKGMKVNSNLFHVNILPDYSPQIVAVSAVDSSSANGMFFSGHITDDYGFHSLTFNCFDSNNPKAVKSESIELYPGISQDFYFYFDFSNMSKSVSYYFEVKDNDAVSGFKSAKTPLSVYTTITNEEKQQRVDNLNSSIFDKVNEAQRLLRDLNNDLNDFQKNVSSNSQISDWEKQLKIDNLKQRQEKLNDLLQDLQQDNMSKNAFENQLSPEMGEELLERQRQMQQMWEDLLTDDVKELLDKINEMTNSLSEKNLRDNIQDLKFDFNQISEQLDRNNELMKMYNIDNNLQNISNDLDKMSKEYKQLSQEMKSGADKNDAPLSDKMQDFSKRFDDLNKKYQDLLKQNEELGGNKLSIEDLKKDFAELQEKLNLQKNEMQKLDKEAGRMSEKPSEKAKENDGDSKNSQNRDLGGKDSDGDKASEMGENGNLDSKSGEKSSDKNAEKSDKTPSGKDSDSVKGDPRQEKINSDSAKTDLDSEKTSENSKDSYDLDLDKNGEVWEKESVPDKKQGEKSDGAKRDKSSVEEKSGVDKQSNQNSSRETNDKNEKSDSKSETDSRNQSGSDRREERKKREQISQQMDESSEEMKDLSNRMQGMDKKNKQKRTTENLNDIRQILDNLLSISFNQETLIERLKKNTTSLYLTTDLLRDQNAISKDFELVQDSIYALAKRTPKLGSSVYDKIENIHNYSNKIINGINENRRGEIMNNQQFLLSNVNDLSLLFNEIADDMQKQQQQEGNEGEESENEAVKTRNKKEMQQREQSTQQMKSQQQKLKENLQKMLQQLQQGDKPSSQQLAESLRQQEMMLQKLQEMQNGKGISPKEQQLMNQIQQMMEDNKRDIVNKQINQRTIDRQNTLFNKLLDLENAEKSQDFDEKRESKQGSDFQNNNNGDFNFKLKDFGVKEFIHTAPLNLNLFYQNKYNDYMQNIE